MRMDHHCPWTGNCVGLKNNKYFICFLFWTIIACLFVWASSKYFLNVTPPKKGCGYPTSDSCFGFFNPSTASQFSLGVSIGVSIMLVVHGYLVNTNGTSLELGELMSFNPYRLSKRSDNNAELLGTSFINKLNPFSIPKEEYGNEKNELYCGGLVYPVN